MLEVGRRKKAEEGGKREKGFSKKGRKEAEEERGKFNEIMECQK